MRPARPIPLLVVLASIAALGWALCVGGCVTPSIPIPPPAPESMVFEVDVTAGEATFAYPANDNYADATVYVLNRTQGRGVIVTARADGSVAPTPPFPAAYGDQVAVTIEADVQLVSTCVVLTTSGARPDC